jgi:hypothetical protein
MEFTLRIMQSDNIVSDFTPANQDNPPLSLILYETPSINFSVALQKPFDTRDGFRSALTQHYSSNASTPHSGTKA